MTSANRLGIVAGLLFAFAAIAAGETPVYEVKRTTGPMVIDGKLLESDWQNTSPLSSFQFAWWTQGAKEPTTAKLLWDDTHLFVAYDCTDAHIWGTHTEHDSAVYQDDCVEVFTAPNWGRPNDYFNLEMNVRGELLDEHHPDGPGVSVDQPWNSSGIQIAVSIDGTLNDDSDTDQSWTLEAAIPLANFRGVAMNVPPKPGDNWRLNLNRLGGQTNPQFSQWSPGTSNEPNFHRPGDFGTIVFSRDKPLASRRWKTSRIHGTPDPPTPYTTERVFEDLSIDLPTDMVLVPQTNRWLITEAQSGRAFSFAKDGARDVVDAIDLKQHPDGCKLLYGISFHPKFPSTPTCFISYTTNRGEDDVCRVSRFNVRNPDTPEIILDSETELFSWPAGGHDGGCMRFGRDGYLYVSVGDTKPPNPPDPLNTGQDISDLGSSVLRIDIDHPQSGLPYGIPADNPFIDLPGARPEVWAFGFRNPWKMAFDPSTDDLWVADVGWEMNELVYRVQAGGNYGWSVMEGSQVVKANGTVGPTPVLPPTAEHTHLEARSITGGWFWKSERLPELRDAYIYGDWTTGKIWALKHDGDRVTKLKELADTTLQIVTFGIDDDGEVLVVGYDGTIHRLIENPAAAATASFPRRLSQTGLFESVADQRPSPGVIPYDINAHHWADHTVSKQWVAIPDGDPITLYPRNDWRFGFLKGHFSFPHDAVLAKTVSFSPDQTAPTAKVHLETQILHHNGDAWNAYNYVWNDDQTDAILQDNVATDREITVRDPSSPGGIRTQTWHHSSRDECLQCHFWNASTVLGFQFEQLNRDDSFSDRGQLDRLMDSGIFEPGLTEHPAAKLEPIVSPHDADATLEDRARSYLHLNCAHCHRNGGGGTATFQLVNDVSLDAMKLIDEVPTQGLFNIHDARVVASGDPYRSVLFYRLIKGGRGRMPQFGTNVADDRGIAMIHDWITSLSTDNESSRNDQLTDLASWPRQTPLSTDFIAQIESALTSTTSATRLAYLCSNRSVTPSVRNEIAKLATARPDPIVRDLFERHLPAELRITRLGTNINIEALLAQHGNAATGRKMYATAADISCRQCHAIAGLNSAEQGVHVGPDLTRIAADRTPREILDSILNPSAKIEAKYRGKLILTLDGEVISGLIASETDQQITLIDASGKQNVINRDDIETMDDMKTSLMPERLLSEFTEQQAADLLAFLNSLK